MATRIIQEQSDDTKMTVEFSNGDLRSLRAVVERWKFADITKALLFALAALSDSKKNKIGIFDDNGVGIAITPSDSLLKIDGSSSDEADENNSNEDETIKEETPTTE